MATGFSTLDTNPLVNIGSSGTNTVTLVATPSVYTGADALRVSQGGTAYFEHTWSSGGAAWPDPTPTSAAGTDFEVLALVRLGASRSFGIEIFSASQAAYSGLWFGLDWDSIGVDNNSGSTEYVHGLTINTTTWYWLRFRKRSGNFTGAIWVDGTSEPSSDLGTRAIGTPWSGGATAIADLCFALAADGGGTQSSYIDYISWGTNGDAAPRPFSTGSTGSFTGTDGADAAAFSGTVAYPPITGSFTGTDGADAGAVAGKVFVLGSLAATDGADAAELEGEVTDPPITGLLSGTDGADSAALAGQVVIAGALDAADGADSAEFSGQVRDAELDRGSGGGRRKGDRQRSLYDELEAEGFFDDAPVSEEPDEAEEPLEADNIDNIDNKPIFVPALPMVPPLPMPTLSAAQEDDDIAALLMAL